MMFQYIRDETRRAVSPARAGSSTVPWERKGETPLRDPISGNPVATLQARTDRTNMTFLQSP